MFASLPSSLEVHTRLVPGPANLRLFTQEIVASAVPQKAALPVLVLTAGWLQSTKAWMMQHALAEQGHCRLITWDLPLQGRSRPTSHTLPSSISLSPDLYAQSLRCVLAAYDLLAHPADFVGWSYGGIVLRHYLARFGDEGIGRVIFVGSGIWGQETLPAELEQSMGESFRLLFIQGPEQWLAVERFVGNLTALPLSEDQTEMLRTESLCSLMQMQTFAVPPSLALLQGGNPRESQRVAALLSLRETLIVQGAADALVPAGFARSVLAPQIGGRLFVHPTCGHTPHLEAPDWFNRQVLQFISPSSSFSSASKEER